jgi:hypothetical protein
LSPRERQPEQTDQKKKAQQDSRSDETQAVGIISTN